MRKIGQEMEFKVRAQALFDASIARRHEDFWFHGLKTSPNLTPELR
jgi:hypothetical protein